MKHNKPEADIKHKFHTKLGPTAETREPNLLTIFSLNA
jgi:hypothetical protein